MIERILNFSINDYSESISIQFSLTGDEEDSFRLQEISKENLFYYYPQIIDEWNWGWQLEEALLVVMLESYYEENPEDLPSRQLL